MAKDYFSDIVPPNDSSPHESDKETSDVDSHADDSMAAMVPERSIRNISVNRSHGLDRREVPPVGSGLPVRRRSFSPRIIWLAAIILILALGGLGLFAFRKTTVTVTARTQTITFDQARSYTAYPTTSSATGTLSYSLNKFDTEDSQVVAAQGTAHAEHKASGSITIFNEFSSSPVKLIKNTRFATADGLVFRTPEDVSIPGMNGATAGSVTITVIADETGTKYNIPSTPKFTLPGLKGGAMFSKVYARSTEPFTGGFSGDEPAVAPETLRAAQAEMRGRIQDKIQSNLKSLSSSLVVFANLSEVTYEDAAPTNEDAGHVRLHEKAHVIVPVFKTDEFIKLVGAGVATDLESSSVSIIPMQGYGLKLLSASSTLGVDPLTFGLSGSAELSWQVDANALANALAGKDQSSFQTIVKSFSSIQDARARIEPFWKSTFPNEASKIVIVVSNPTHAK